MKRAAIQNAFQAVLLSVLGLECSSIYAPSPEGESPRYCTVYNHMVKSGGTSIKYQLMEGSTKEGDAKPGICTKDGTGYSPQCYEALFNSSIITGYGELLRHPLEEIGRECEYFTMMRHPISRLVSAFFYCPKDHDEQKRPTKWCGNMEDPEPMTARLQDFAENSAWGYMAYKEMMFGIYCWAESSLCEDKYSKQKPPKGLETPEGLHALAEIEANLRRYKAVGIFEEWQLSMNLFDATVTSSVRNWDATMSLNHGDVSPDRASVLEWAYLSPEINVAVAPDILLYDYAMLEFKRQTSEALGTVWS